MEPNRTASLGVITALTLLLVGCGSGARALCERADECGYTNDVDECTSDIQDAVSDGDLERKQVRDCLQCAEDNDCGTDIIIDCGNECEDVGAYVFGSNF